MLPRGKQVDINYQDQERQISTKFFLSLCQKAYKDKKNSNFNQMLD
jgi:hypothetical protein